MVEPYPIQGEVCNPLSPRKYAVLNGNFILDLRDFDLSDVFQDRNSGVKRDLPVRTALFWFIKQRVVVIPYRRFGTTYLSHLQRSREDR